METDEICVSSNPPESKEASSSDRPNTMVEEVSSSDRNATNTTLGDVKSAKQMHNTSLASDDEIQNLVGGTDIKGLEAVLEKAVDMEDGGKATRGMVLESMSIGQRDALLLFRTLCKMGMKEDRDEVTTKSRILSLELLQGLLEGASHSFAKSFQFIDSIKLTFHMHYCEHLCPILRPFFSMQLEFLLLVCCGLGKVSRLKLESSFL